MCGIVHVKRKDGKPANRSVRKRYFEQKERGVEGFGYVAIENDRVVSYKRSAYEHEILKALNKETASEILFHHRLPTSGPNVEEMAHPIKVENPKLKHQYYIVHNGVIRNTKDRKKVHEAAGFTYTTQLKSLVKSLLTDKAYWWGDDRHNDSESIAIDTAAAIDGTEKSIDSEGPAAIVGLQVDGDKVIDRFFYRNYANPLHFHEDDTMISLTSKTQASGRSVPTVRVMRLKEGGDMEEHPKLICTSSVYKTSYSGYGQSAAAYAGYDDDIPLGGYLMPAKLNEYLTTPEIAKMTTTELWRQYNTSTDVIDGLRIGIGKYDASVQDTEVVSESVLKGRVNLQKRLDTVVEYRDKIDRELTNREVNTLRITG